MYLGIFDVLEILSTYRALVLDDCIAYCRSVFVSLKSMCGTFGSGVKHLVALWAFKLRFVHWSNQPIANSLNAAKI